jgi:hypothetical protein
MCSEALADRRRKSGEPRVAHQWYKHSVDTNVGSENLDYQQALWASCDRPMGTGEGTLGSKTNSPNADVL